MELEDSSLPWHMKSKKGRLKPIYPISKDKKLQITYYFWIYQVKMLKLALLIMWLSKEAIHGQHQSNAQIQVIYHIKTITILHYIFVYFKGSIEDIIYFEYKIYY